MATEMEPVIGTWYFDADAQRNFEVINVDDDEGLVEVRDAEGESDEYLLDAWFELNLEPGAPPDDWMEDEEEPADEGVTPRRGGSDELSDEQYRRASGWGERSPDDFPDEGGSYEPDEDY